MRSTRALRSDLPQPNNPSTSIPKLRPSLTFRAIRVAALALPIAASTLYLLDINDGQLTPPSLFSTAARQPQPLTLRSANIALRREQQTQYFSLDPNTSQLGRVDIVRLPSNAPVEDEFSTAGTISGLAASYLPTSIRSFISSRGASSRWSFFGVYDGHAGWATSAYLRQYLIPAVSGAVGSTADGPGSPHAEAMRGAFLAIDGKIMQTALAAVRDSASRGTVADAKAIAALAPAMAGSCALVAGYNPVDSKLMVACTGDSRAVLGRRQGVGYSALPLSVDQTGSSPDEVARLNALHPDEPIMMKVLREKGRLFGLMPTRAFGDHRLKLDTDVLKQIQEEQFGSGPRDGAVSQPYVTAEPEVTETVIQRGVPVEGGRETAGDFVILASDGLWDHISSEDAVYCVEKWLEAKRSRQGVPFREGRRQAEIQHADEGEPASKEKLYYLKDGYVEWNYKRDWLVAEDDNAATHLVRNVLGGRNRGFFCGLLSTCSPLSRNVRDDITVQVIFFGGVE